MFMVGVIPAALLILYIYACVPELRFFSRESARQKNAGTIPILRQHGKVALFAILLMTGFNFFSHGTQDIYATFLRVQHGFDPLTVKNMAVIANIGAIMADCSLAPSARASAGERPSSWSLCWRCR